MAGQEAGLLVGVVGHWHRRHTLFRRWLFPALGTFGLGLGLRFDRNGWRCGLGHGRRTFSGAGLPARPNPGQRPPDNGIAAGGRLHLFLLCALRPARRDTLPFNGYAEQVAGLYAGMDLKANY